MKKIPLCFGATLVAFWVAAGQPETQTGTNFIQLTTISLPDQHNQPHVFAFPQPGVSVLTVADHKGSEQIEPWVRALKTRYPTNLPVEGLADVSSVPAPLRPFIRKRFRDAFAHPVMLDWKGRVVPLLKPTPDVANVYALNPEGVVLLRLRGAADDEKLSRLFAVLEAPESQLPATNHIAAKPSSKTGP
jgi:hypothetical protein